MTKKTGSIVIRKIFQDTRAFGFIFLMSFSIYSIVTPSYGRTASELILTLSTAILLDYLYLRFYKKVSMFPLSGLISSFGIFLLCDSPNLWMYPLLVFIGITSKHFLVVNGKHIFNPNNFGLVCGVLFFDSKMTIISGRWGGYGWLVGVVIALGTFIIFRVKKPPIVISYIFSFILFAFIRTYFYQESLTWNLMPLTGPAFFLFAFYMLTDPRTTPVEVPEQIIFGIMLAGLEAIFRINQNKYAQIFSLFILCGSYYCLKDLFHYSINKARKLQSV